MMMNYFTPVSRKLLISKKLVEKNIIYDYILRFDGCSKGNPGLAGAGAVLYYKDKEFWNDSSFVGVNQTNNYAEYSGLLLGLRKAYELNINELNVQGDSMLVIKHMNDEYKIKSQNLIPLYSEAKMISQHFHSITFSHIYRNLNKRADELSNIPISEYENSSIPTTKNI